MIKTIYKGGRIDRREPIENEVRCKKCNKLVDEMWWDAHVMIPGQCIEEKNKDIVFIDSKPLPIEKINKKQMLNRCVRK